MSTYTATRLNTLEYSQCSVKVFTIHTITPLPCGNISESPHNTNTISDCLCHFRKRIRLPVPMRESYTCLACCQGIRDSPPGQRLRTIRFCRFSLDIRRTISRSLLRKHPYAHRHTSCRLRTLLPYIVVYSTNI